jgi:GNAT superfamily N-acetyltransferase
METLVTRQVPALLVDQLWQLHEQAFIGLRTRAAQAHHLDRTSFGAILDDERVGKYIVLDDAHGGLPCGISTLTNDLEAIPLISTEYYAHRWPDYYRGQLIWYVGFLAVHPDYQGRGVIRALISRMCAEAADTGGVMAADICEYNETVRRLTTTIARLACTYAPEATPLRLDAQVYWALEFPTPRGTGETVR